MCQKYLLKTILKGCLLNFGTIVLIARGNKLDLTKAAKIWPNALNISAFISTTRCTKLDFNMKLRN